MFLTTESGENLGIVIFEEKHFLRAKILHRDIIGVLL